MIEVPYPTTWVRDRVVLRVFDAQGKDIADFDATTGLAFVLREEDGKWFVGPDLSNIPDGRWVFDAVYVTGGTVDEPITPHTIHMEGVKAPGDVLPEVPTRARARGDRKRVPSFDYEGAWLLFASYEERQQRMSICRGCPKYDHATGTCTVDGDFMAAKTKVAGEVCPEGKWGQASNYSDEALAARQARSVPQGPMVPEGQDEFEAEWEAHHASR